MKLIGITGGIGMGKSTAGELLRQRGFPVIDTDVIARQLVEPGQSALEKIKDAFGACVLDSHGCLRRDELAKIVFADAAAREKLESILHPPIREAWQSEADRCRNENKPLGFVIIPLLFETKAKPLFHAIICVGCSHETQLQRLAERGWSPKQIEQRQQSQWPIEKKMDAADYVIWSDASLDIHSAQLEQILGQLS